MNDWLYDKIERVPKITDSQIAAMRHIEPVLKVPDSCMYRRIKNADKLHPRKVSFLWDAEPIGGEFTFNTLNVSRIITQHHGGVFFKPSLAEVYAWILVYMPKHWKRVQFFCMGEYKPVGSSSDFLCDCEVMGGVVLVGGEEVRFPSGAIGYRLVPLTQ